MSRSNPAKALNGVRSGHICDRCNKRIRTGDLVRAYATYYKENEWVLRRVWCRDCGDTTIGEKTDGYDEAIVGAIFWNHQLKSAKTKDLSTQ